MRLLSFSLLALACSVFAAPLEDVDRADDSALFSMEQYRGDCWWKGIRDGCTNRRQ
ncbi:hypothetical protein FRC15_011278 [Serendipita sp. 397]|nr:hypothetical protein FRC15_011278 [Serendipita sp. 397]